MAEIRIEEATPDRWDDVQHALSGGGDGASCQCLWPMLLRTDWQASTREQRTEMFHHEVSAGPVPGLLAYIDEDAVGWVRVGPRPAQKRLARTRLIAAATTEPFDDESVWAISCFVVRREHRRRGVTSALLAAAIEHARRNSARVIEGYPVDTSLADVSVNDLFHGTLSTFLAAGFTASASPKPSRPLVSLRLAD